MPPETPMMPTQITLRVADRYVLRERLASRYLQAEESAREEFDRTEGDKSIKNPNTGRDIKIRSLRNHDDAKLKKLYDDAFEKWNKKDKGSAVDEVRAKLNTFLSRVKGVSKAMATAVKNAPAETQRLVQDKAYRNEQLKAAGQALRKAPKKIGKRAWQAVKDEAHATFVESPKIVHSVFKEKRLPTRKEAKTLYGTAVYMGGFALAAIPALPAMGGAGAVAGITMAASAGAHAFAHSFSMHVACKTLSYMFEPDAKFGITDEVKAQLADMAERASRTDEGFLAYEALETAAGTGANAEKFLGVKGVMHSLSAMMPASKDLYEYSPWSLLKNVGDMVSSLVAAEDSEEDKTMNEFFEKFTETMAKVLEDGISDEEMEAILQEDAEGTMKARS